MAYITKIKSKPGKYKNYEDVVRGENAEKVMFDALNSHFKGSTDDVLVVSSHKFLNDSSNNEKDFIVSEKLSE